MQVLHIAVLYLFNILATPVCCWQYFSQFKELNTVGSTLETFVQHSVYRFGDCRREGIIKYTSAHLSNIDVLGKLIVRGWISFTPRRIPTCIILKAYSTETDQFRQTAYNFQMCVPRITYLHSKKQFRYYFYEWYIPIEYYGGMDWDIDFYGPPSSEWQ